MKKEKKGIKLKKITISNTKPLISVKLPSKTKKTTVKFEPGITQRILLQKQVLREQEIKDQKFRSILNQKNVYFND